MKKYLKLLFLIGFVAIGFQAKSAFAFTCMANATGNWGTAGTWINCNSTVPQAGDDVTATTTAAITVTVNVTTNALKSFDFSGLTTGGGTMAGASSLTVRGLQGTTQDIKFGGTVSWTGTTVISTTSTTASINITSNGKLLNSFTTAAGVASTITQQDNIDLSAVKTNSIIMGATAWNMNNFYIKGNSATNRFIIQSNTPGTSRTLTLNGGSAGASSQFANIDFEDIAFNNGGSDLDLSAITGLSGDCNGNTMNGGGTLTLTSGTTQTATGASSASAAWSGLTWTSRVPLCSDDAIVNTNFISGRTITNDMPRMGKSLDFSGMTWAGTPTNFLISIAGGNTFYGSLTFVTGMTTSGGGGSSWESRGRTTYTITSAGVSITRALALNMFNGTLTMQDALNMGAAASALQINIGTFNTNASGFSLTSAATNGITVLSGATISLNSSTVTLTGTGSVWNASTSATVSASSSTIIITDVTVTSKTFAGGGKTYGTVTWTGANIIITSNNTFSTMNFNNATTSTLSTAGVLFTGLSTTTITSTITSNGSAGVLAIATSTTASAWVIEKTGGGTVCVDFMRLARSTARPTLTWYAGTGSTDVGSNTNWSFTACPSTAGILPEIYQNGDSYINGDGYIKN